MYCRIDRMLSDWQKKFLLGSLVPILLYMETAFRASYQPFLKMPRSGCSVLWPNAIARHVRQGQYCKKPQI